MSDNKTKYRKNANDTRKDRDSIMESGQKRVKTIKPSNDSHQERKPQKENKTPKNKGKK